MKDKLVAVDYEITHYPFFRLGGGQSGIMKIPFFGGYWEVHSTDFPNFFDLDIFLGALKLYQDAELRDKVIESSLYTFKNREGILSERKTKTVRATHYQLCKYSGLPLNGTSYKKIDRTLKRLALLTAFRIDKKDPTKQRMMRFLAYHEGDGQKNVLCFDGDFIDACVSSQLLVRYKEIQSLTSQINKALLMFIEGNETNFYRGIPEERIFRYFGIRKPVFPKDSTKKNIRDYHNAMRDYREKANDKRSDIVPALKLFRNDGLIMDYIISERFGVKIYEIGKRASVKEKHERINAKKRKNNQEKTIQKQDDYISKYDDESWFEDEYSEDCHE